MITGMLWFDNDSKKLLSKKIEEAKDYYFKKYGQVADVCVTNPTTLAQKKDNEVLPMQVRADRSIALGTFWIGCEDKETIQPK